MDTKVYATINVRAHDRARFNHIRELMGVESSVEAFARILDTINVDDLRRARVESLRTEAGTLETYGDLLAP